MGGRFARRAAIARPFDDPVADSGGGVERLRLAIEPDSALRDPTYPEPPDPIGDL